jgi:hypothetical protein
LPEESSVRVRFPGVLMSVLLVISAIGLSEAACQPKPPDNGARASAQIAPPAARPPQSSANTPKPAPRPAPARRAARPAGEEYAQSYYDYRSASRVIERFSFEPRFRRPVRFDRDRFYGPRYPRRYYAPGSGYPPPPPAYSQPRPDTRLDRREFNGGVGDTGAGSGYGGQAYLYPNQSGGSAMPSNGGGVNLPPGYGPDYRGAPQGPLPPTRGGLNAGSR